MANAQIDKFAELTPTVVYNQKLSTLAKQLDLSNSVGFDTPLLGYVRDFADDNSHPGELSNKIFADVINKTFCNFI